jgi:hypothetical protein
MLVPFNIVKGKDRSITGRQLSNRLVQGDPVNHRHRIGVFRASFYLVRGFAVLSRVFHAHSTFAEMHQHLVDGEAVKPRRESGLAPKTTDFSKELYEDLLSEIFSLRDISGHPQAERINATIMALEKLLESSHVSLGGFLSQLIVSRLRCLGFGCGHVFVCSGKLGIILQLPACSARFSRFRQFQGSGTFPRTTRVGMRCQVQYPQTAAVMRRFERVVALPDPKNY